MTLYERIRKLRKDSGMSQEDLARAMGYKDRSMITKIESGKVDISQKKIIEFARVLNTTPGYLMGWETEERDVEGILLKGFNDYYAEHGMPKVALPPKTPEARILAKGIDKMPQAQREAIVSMMQGLYPGLFEKGTEEDET